MRNNVFPLNVKTKPRPKSSRSWWQSGGFGAASGTISRDAAVQTVAGLLRFAKEKPAEFAKFLNPNQFSSFADFVIAVANARDGAIDKRLVRAPLSEGDPSSGGFMVPEVWAEKIIGSIYESAVLAPLTDMTEIGNPAASFKIPAIDETSRQNGSQWGGAVGYWAAEAAQVSGSRPTWRSVEMATHKLIGVVWLTNELLADAPMLEAHIQRVLKSVLGSMLDQAIFAGSGAGQPLGLIASPCRITVAKQPGQAPATIVPQNIADMWSRMPAPCRPRSIWITNEDCEKQFDGSGASAIGSTIPGYIPAGVGGAPFATLKGRPILPVEFASPIGSEGDIVLCDLTQYLTIQAPPAFALSAHFGFDTDQAMVRFALRVDGKPAWASPITPMNGGSPRSPIVTLGAR